MFFDINQFVFVVFRGQRETRKELEVEDLMEKKEKYSQTMRRQRTTHSWSNQRSKRL